MPLQLTVSIYNSAGEKVKSLYSGKAQQMTGDFKLDQSLLVPGGVGLNLNFGGALQNGGTTLIWMGDNDNGQSVSGGTYYFKTEMVDAFGTVQAWSQSVIVMPQGEAQSLNIYNSAGELVATLNTGATSTAPLTQVGFRDSGKNAYALGGSGIEFVLQDAGGAQIVRVWDGKSNNGKEVSSGSYTVQLVDNSVGHQVLMSKGFVLLADPAASKFAAIVGPNPVAASNTQVVIQGFGMTAGETMEVALFSVSGELVVRGVESGSTHQITLKCANWSAGIYIANVELKKGQAIRSRKMLKIAVQR